MGAIRNLINKATEQLDQTQLLQEALEYAKLKKVQNDEQAVAAAREYAANREQYRPAMQFMSWANNSYGGFRNQNEFQSAITQYKYNRDRKNRGLSELQFTDITYDPTQFDDDKNEYNISYFSKNSEYPTEYGNAYQDFLNQKKVKTQYEAIGRTDYTDDSTQVEFDDGWKRKGYDYDPNDPEDLRNKELGLPPKAVMSKYANLNAFDENLPNWMRPIYEKAVEEDGERLREGRLPKTLERSINSNEGTWAGENYLEGAIRGLENLYISMLSENPESYEKLLKEYAKSWEGLNYQALGDEGESLRAAVKKGLSKNIEQHEENTRQQIDNITNNAEKRLAAMWDRYSNINDNPLKGDIATTFQGLGQLTLQLGASAINPIAGKTLLYGSARGGAIGEALQDGAALKDAKRYGSLSGLTEVGLEWMSGGIGGLAKNSGLMKFATRSLDNLGSTFAKKVISRALSSGGEGLEEVMSTIISPYIKRATYDPDAASATLEESIESFKGGFLPSMVLGFGVDALNIGGRKNAKAIGSAVNDETNTLFTVEGKYNTDKTNALFERDSSGVLRVVPTEDGQIKLGTELQTKALMEKNHLAGKRFIPLNVANNIEAQIAIRNYIEERGIETFGVEKDSPFAKMLSLDSETLQSTNMNGVESNNSSNQNNGASNMVNAEHDGITPEVVEPNILTADQAMLTGAEPTQIPQEISFGKVTVPKDIPMSVRQKASVQAINKIAEVTGVNFEIHPTIKNANGFYDPNSNTIHIAMDATDQAMLRTTSHELTHYIKKWSQSQYDKLKEFLVQRFNLQDETIFDALVERKIQSASEQGVALNYDQGVDEVVADACEMMLKDSVAIKTIVEKNRSLGEKIRDFIRDFNKKIKTAFHKVEANSLEANMLREMSDSLTEAQRLWDEALVGAAKANRNSRQGLVDGNKAVQYSISDNGKYVILDRNIFDGVEQKDRAKVLLKYLENNLAGKPVTTWIPNPSTGKIDDWSSANIAYIAKKGERVGRNQALRKLPYPGRNTSNVRQDLASHVDELLAVSDFTGYGSDKNSKHGKSARNGWEYRKAYARTGDSANERWYECSLNIALGNEKDILYDINKIKEIKDRNTIDKIKKLDRGVSAGESTIKTDSPHRQLHQVSFDPTIPQDGIGINTSIRNQQGKDTSDIQYSLAGRKAENADTGLLDLAKNMEKSNEDVSAIWQETGWIKGEDGSWRFEIDDSKARLVDSAYRNLCDDQEVSLGELLDHTALMENYPELSTVRVQSNHNMKGYYAGFVPEEKKIYISKETLRSKDFVLESILHEVQHVIQDIESFEIGGRGGVVDRAYVREKYGKEIADDPEYLKASQADQERMIMEHLYEKAPQLREENVTFDTLVAFEYMNMVGEREAFLTANRRNMTVKERRSNVPGIYKRTLKNHDQHDYDETMAGVRNENSSDQPRQLRDTRMSTRELLSNALLEVAQSDQERALLKEYQEAIPELEEAEKRVQELGAKLKELSFAKGPRDMREITLLRARKAGAETKLNAKENKLLRLEAAKPLQDLLKRQRNAVIAKEKQKARANLKKYRAARIEREDIIRIRGEIRRITEDWAKKLQSNSKDSHIPEGLKKPVLDLLREIDFTTPRMDPSKKRSLYWHFTRLQKAYENLAKNESLEASYLASEYNTAYIRDMIDDVLDAIGDKAVNDLSLDELRRVRNGLKSLRHVIVVANEAFFDEKRAKISSMANQDMVALTELSNRRKRNRFLETKAGQWVEERKASQTVVNIVKNGLMKPVYFFETFHGTNLERLGKNLFKAEDNYARQASEDLDFARKTMQEANYWDWKADKKSPFKLASGDTPRLSLGDRMSLYATYQTEKNGGITNHLLEGGFSLPEDSKSKVYKVTESDIAAIEQSLTAKQRDFVDAMVNYLSTVCAERGNETALKRLGVKIFNMSYYYPISTDQNFVVKDPGKGGDKRIANMAFTKQRIKGSVSPLVIKPFMDTWAMHTDNMNIYSAFSLPIEDLQRVWNFKDPSDRGKSVKASIAEFYGKAGNDYISRLIEDLNGGVRSSQWDRAFSGLLRNVKKSAVMANMSVMIQQPFSIVRAGAHIESKYLARASSTIPHYKREYQEMKKYAPVAIIKEWGYFDTHMGQSFVNMTQRKQYGKLKDKTKGFIVDGDYRSDILSAGAQNADEIAWAMMWRAAKYKVEDTTNLKKGSTEYYEAANEIVRDVINHTQVYDSVLQRTPLMRDKSQFVQGLMAFMSEPLTTYNMLVSAVNDARIGSKKVAMKKIAYAFASVVATSAAQSVISALRDDEDEKRDKDGNIIGNRSYGEKYLDALKENIFSGAVGIIPFAGDVVSMFQGYKPQNLSMQSIYKLTNSIGKMVEKGFSWEAAKEIGLTLSDLSGVPIKNIERDIRAIWQTGEDMFTNFAASTGTVYDKDRPIKERFAAAKKNYDIKEKTDDGELKSSIGGIYYDLYYDAIVQRDPTAPSIKKHILSSGRTEEEFDSAIRSRLVGRGEEAKKLDAYSLVAKGGEAINIGDLNTYEDAVNSMENMGLSEYVARGAIRSYVSKYLDEKDEDEDEYDGKYDLYFYSDLHLAIDTGNTRSINKLMQYNKQMGKEKKNVQSSVTRRFKDDLKKYYKTNNTKYNQLRKTLLSLQFDGEYLYSNKALDKWLQE